MDWTQVLLTITFYVLMILLYRYSKGKYHIKDDIKRERYLEWVDKHGATTSKSFLWLSIIYTIALLFRMLS